MWPPHRLAAARPRHPGRARPRQRAARASRSEVCCPPSQIPPKERPMIERLRFDEQPERLPPHNLEAEEAVLGSCLLDRETVVKLDPILKPRDFYRERNGEIYAAMLELVSRYEPVDYLTLIDELDRTGTLLAAGGTSYVAQLLGVVPTPIHAEHYARIVADCGFMRRLISAGGKIATIGFQNQHERRAAMAMCEQILADVDGSAAPEGFMTLVEALQEQEDRLIAREAIEGAGLVEAGLLPTAFVRLDQTLGGGFQRGDLVLLAARPRVGKTALMLSLISGAALSYGLQVAVFSLEMTTRALADRLVAAHSGVPLEKISKTGRMSPPQLQAYGEARGRLAMADIVIDQTARQDMATITSKARRQARVSGLDVVVIDHIQLLPQGKDRYAAMTQISGDLKALARELNVVVIALSQLNRKAEERRDQSPILSDLRETGALEQDADEIGRAHV